MPSADPVISSNGNNSSRGSPPRGIPQLERASTAGPAVGNGGSGSGGSGGSGGGGGGIGGGGGGGIGGGGGGGPSAIANPGAAASPAPRLRRRAMSATLDKVREAMPSASNKKDLVQWFLPTEKNRKESLIEAAQAAADAAEEARRACLSSWAVLRSSLFNAIQV